MNVLGITGGFDHTGQDVSACLFMGNRLVAAVEEERLILVKHSPNRMPEMAIRFCLKAGDIGIRQVDRIAFYANHVRESARLRDWFKFTFGYCPKIIFSDHHYNHAASAFYGSGFSESMIMTYDFSGDGKAGILAYGQGKKINILNEFHKPNSLGIFYSLMTQYLGFQFDDDEYKVMGLAAYGKPDFYLGWIVELDSDGYRFDPGYVSVPSCKGSFIFSRQEKIVNEKLFKKLGNRMRSRGEPITDYHKNLAASVQKLTEDIAAHLARSMHRKTGCRNLCLAGGVALNCVVNQRLKDLPFIDNIFVHPASHDAGCALGSAMNVLVANGIVPDPVMSMGLGPRYSNGRIRNFLNMFNIKYKRSENIHREAAMSIAEGKVVGYFQGASELGPRALGFRSICADARNRKMKDRVNRVIKFREEFRPFAPSILEEDAGAYFKNKNRIHSPYMTVTFDTTELGSARLPATTHIDGTARVQTVDKATSPGFHALLTEYKAITGTPAILNTSFNIKGQPIVEHPQQALATFFGTGMDCLAIGDFWLEK